VQIIINVNQYDCEIICEDIKMKHKFESYELDTYFGKDENSLFTGEEILTIKLINKARKL